MGSEKELRRANNIANHALATRERTEHELRALLGRRGVPDDAAEQVLAALGDVGLIDDGAYAVRFAEDKRELAGWGSDRIRRELEKRGVRTVEIEAALAAYGRGDELEAAVGLLGTRFPGPLPDDRTRNRAWQLLVRRGYEPELAYEAVREHGRKAA